MPSSFRASQSAVQVGVGTKGTSRRRPGGHRQVRRGRPLILRVDADLVDPKCDPRVGRGGEVPQRNSPPCPAASESRLPKVQRPPGTSSTSSTRSIRSAWVPKVSRWFPAAMPKLSVISQSVCPVSRPRHGVPAPPAQQLGAVAVRQGHPRKIRAGKAGPPVVHPRQHHLIGEAGAEGGGPGEPRGIDGLGTLLPLEERP